MFWHVGSDRTLLSTEVILVLDPALLPVSPELRQLVGRLRMDGQLASIGPGPTRALILTDNGMIAAPISPRTLKRRAARAVQVRGNPGAML